MNQNLKQRIEAEAAEFAKSKQLEPWLISTGQTTESFIKGGLFALEMDRWIEVENGLPPHCPEDDYVDIHNSLQQRSEWVLVSNGKTMWESYYSYTTKTWHKGWNDATHWQPLPSLPNNKNS